MSRSKKKAQVPELNQEEDIEVNLQNIKRSTSKKKRKGKNKEEIHGTQDTVTTAVSAESKKKSSKKTEKVSISFDNLILKLHQGGKEKVQERKKVN